MSSRHHSGRGFGSTELVRRDRARRRYLFHQVLVPLALDLDMGGGAEFDRLDQIVVHIRINAGFAERVERGARRAAADEPGLEILLRRVVVLCRLPNTIAAYAAYVR